MKTFTKLMLLAAGLLLAITACKKENDDSPAPSTPSYSNQVKTSISGQVTDEANTPLAGVAVSLNGKSTTTNAYGVFVIKNAYVPADRAVLNFTKSGFFKHQQAFLPEAGVTSYVRIRMLEKGMPYTVSGVAGGTVTLPGGSSVVFQANGFVTADGSAYTGTVSVIAKHLSPANAGFGFSIPGGDLQAINAANERTGLYSYGMLGVELTDVDGMPLQLATGKPATLNMIIAPLQLATAPASIPLWYYDETTALWKEEGTATKTGNKYSGTVNHFTWWNCDFPSPMPKVTGRVVDFSGPPVSNVIVTIIANNGYSTYAITNQNGIYTFIMTQGFTSTVQFQASLNPPFSQNSQIENVPSLVSGLTYSVADLIVQYPSRVAGTVQTCNGENTDALVVLKENNQLASFQYTQDGQFNLIAPENATVEVQASNAFAYATTTVTTLTAPSIVQTGNLLLCDLYQANENSFSFTDSVAQMQTFVLSLLSSSGIVTDTNINPRTLLLANAFAQPNFNINNFNLYVSDTIPTTTTCDLSLQIVEPSLLTTYSVFGYNLTCTLSEVGPVGGKIKGSYYGIVTILESSATSITTTISGNFSITRTQ